MFSVWSERAVKIITISLCRLHYGQVLLLIIERRLNFELCTLVDLSRLAVCRLFILTRVIRLGDYIRQLE